jgi:hypothetical protein
MRDIRIIEGERFLLEIQHIDRTAEGFKFIADRLDDCAGNGVAMEASNHGQDVQRRF